MILILLLLAVATPVKPYDYYAFAVQNWCNNDYDIHGLWPQYNNGTYPAFCNDAKYQEVAGTLFDNMTVYWNSECNDDTLDNQNFWAHEWSKHGTCTNLNETTYFNKALDLFHSLNNSTWTCGQSTDCIVACFDLNFQNILCPS
jgi:ribonuclease T2